MSSHDYFQSASEQQLRAIVRALCDDSSVRTRALNLYGALQLASHPTSELKRKANSDLWVCVQCDDAFVEEGNTSKSCRYHPGDLETDSDGDFWADHDEDCHGDINTAEMQAQYPEGFVWSCCGKRGNRSGCALGRHESDTRQSKRGGYVPAGSLIRNAGSSEGSIASDEDEEEDQDEDEEDEEGEENDDE